MVETIPADALQNSPSKVSMENETLNPVLPPGDPGKSEPEQGKEPSGTETSAPEELPVEAFEPEQGKEPSGTEASARKNSQWKHPGRKNSARRNPPPRPPRLPP